MNLVETYIYEVERRLPAKGREDIVLELRSTIEDMLPTDFVEQDVKEVLNKLGNPVDLANQYYDRPRQLIGPAYYDYYLTIIKMVLPITVAVVFITFLFSNIFGQTAENISWLSLLALAGEGIWVILNTSIHVFFWTTIVFVLLERLGVSTSTMHPVRSGEEWTADDLKNALIIPRKKAITKGEVFSSMLWTGIWATIYFNAGYLIGIYQIREGQAGLQFATAFFEQEVLRSYWIWIIVLIVMELALAIYQWIVGQWTKWIAAMNLFYNLIFFAIFVVIINNLDLINPIFITHMAEILSLDSSSVAYFIDWLKWVVILVFLATATYYVVDGFLKAKIKVDRDTSS